MMVRAYRYGLLPPVAGGDLVDAQMDLAWRAACARVAIEQDIRAEREAILRAHAPILLEVDAITELRQEARAALAELRIGRDQPQTPEAVRLRQEIRTYGEHLKALRPAAADARRQVRASGQLVAVDARRKAALLAQAQAWSAAGLFWGQRQLVEAAHDQRCKTWGRAIRPPSSWDQVGLQIMGGMSGEAFTAGGDARLAVSAPVPVPGRSGRPLPQVTLRIARDNGTATWPVILHRPIPPEASIRWARVQRRRIGRAIKWELLLTVALPDVRAVNTDAPIVAIYPTATEEGVSASWASENGQRGAYVVHPGILRRLSHASDLQATRDARRDVLIEAMRAWLQTHDRPASWPTSLLHWESCDRWRAFVDAWGRQRVRDDAALFATAKAWAVQDRHLWDWSAHDRARGLARRLDDYRVWAASLARTYGGVVLPDTNYADTKRQQAAPERRPVLHREARTRDRMAMGTLRTVIEQAFVAAGKPVWRLPGETAEQLLRERPGVRVERPTARAPKFARISQMRMERTQEGAIEDATGGPLADGRVSA